ncbi:protein SCO1/2 [Lutibacter sp. Hel_I_33_5]|uniref:SCO family protein n=1 Tax=Lutibacter sp. Hel_I_33_5 TaxID=1566289 RepID=UPI0011A858D1|nr:SCO family protein [Lutibacter sp. Hel_I_33_5]TVZ56553.1 protein SCO1/2 [Lutibacter sp. Hel_I_33_5]
MNLQFLKKSKFTILFFVVFSAIVIPVFYNLLKVDKKLPRLNPIDINPRLVDISVRNKKKNHTIADFKLINQNGEFVTNNTFKDKIYIADFFFTRCQSICIMMAYNMSELQDYYKNDDDIMFLSHSVTPKIDSVSILKKYAIEKGVNDAKWHVTTGDKKQIYALARKSYFAALDEGNGDENDFIHTENFVLIDKERRIVGLYDGTKQKDMKKIMDDIALLKEEYSRK